MVNSKYNMHNRYSINICVNKSVIFYKKNILKIKNIKIKLENLSKQTTLLQGDWKIKIM